MIREASLLPPFIPLREQARWACGLLMANMAVAWVAVGIGLSELRLLVRATGGDAVSPLERSAQLATNETLAWLQGLLFLATAVAFLIWLHQARVNVRALGVRRPAFRREWATLAFLIPVMNLFRPYQVVREIWQASDPNNLDAFNWKNLPVSLLVPAWWGLCVGFVALRTLGWLMSWAAGVSLERLELMALLALGAQVFAGVGAAAAALLVTRISDAQQTKYARQLSGDQEKPECEDDDGDDSLL